MGVGDLKSRRNRTDAGIMKRCESVNRQGRGAAFAIRHKDQFKVEAFTSSAISHRLSVIRISTFRLNNSPNKSVSIYFPLDIVLLLQHSTQQCCLAI